MQPDDITMTQESLISRLSRQETLNFLLTNRVPRAFLTRFVGWWSKIEHPWVCRASIWLWRLFTDLDLSDAKTQQFKSVHECFTRELKEGVRPVDQDPDVLVSPCDTLVGACGTVTDGMLLQVKGSVYPLSELLQDEALVRYYEGASYATLRLTSSMYHRFHAPTQLCVEQVDYIGGDTFNVNPVALKRIERLFCKNERAVVRCRIPSGAKLTLVPVAAILVASIRLTFLDVLLHIRYRGPNVIPCRAPFERGGEMGWFEHGSTIIFFAPPGFTLAPGIQEGVRLSMGQAIMRRQ